MQYGVILPLLDPRTMAELAADAEAAGWNGVFVWDGAWGIDPWIALAAIAIRTEHVRIGTMLTPVSRRKPWELASQVMTLDHLSRGRAILPVGLGAPDTGFDKIGEATDRRVRAAMLDEGLDILDGLWSGKPFSYHGAYWTINDVTFEPRPLQQPRVPLWVVGAWPRMKSMRRALRCDGVLPVKLNDDGTWGEISPADIEAIVVWLAENRTASTPYDIVMEGSMPNENRDQTITKIRALAQAGATWWLDNVWADNGDYNQMLSIDQIRARIADGPPQIR